MQLSIIIVSYNTKEITRNCLQSIRNSKLQLEYEIILVDNASSDGSVQMVREDFPEVRLIANETNNMFAKANNQAMQVAKGDYFLLLNSDTIVEPGNIEKLYAFIDSHQPKVGCVGPRVLNADGSFQAEACCFESMKSVICTALGVILWPLPACIKGFVLPKGYPRFRLGQTRCVDWIPGCSLFIRSSVIKEVGALDEDFSFYHEEVEFCYRLREHGYQVWCVPGSTIIHLGGGSTTDDVLRHVSENALKQRQLYYAKTIGLQKAEKVNACAVLLFGLSLKSAKILGWSTAELLFQRYFTLADERLKYLRSIGRRG